MDRATAWRDTWSTTRHRGVELPHACGVFMVLLGLLAVVEPLAEQLAPVSAGLAVQTTVDVDVLPVGLWRGLGVLALWAAGALAAGGGCWRRGTHEAGWRVADGGRWWCAVCGG
ncbi:hypothetical protein ACWGDT_07150 [Streptomyces avermitilis]